MPLVERLHRGHCWLKTPEGPRRIGESLDDFKIAEHVAGRKAYGACPIAPGTNTTRVALLDFDSHKGETPWPEMLDTAQTVAFALEQEGHTPILFKSSGGNGIHLYLLWDEPQDAYSVRTMLNDTLTVLGYKSGTGGVAEKQIEVFPKQDEVPADGYGSMFVLPHAGKSEPIGTFPGWLISPAVPRRERPPKPERGATDSPELAVLRSALDAIPNDTDPLDYDAWRNVLFAIHHATGGSDEGLALAHEFSARSGKYDADFIDNRFWPYAGVTSGEVITERSLYALAASHGWQDPTIADDFDVVEDTPEDVAARKRFQFVQAAAFSAGKPPGWIIKNVLPRAELIVLYGESGAGKSFVALDLMGAISRGVEWRGHKTHQGLGCGYIAAEGAAGFRNRLQAYAQHHGVALADIPLAILAGAPNFTKRDDVIALGKAMLAYGRLDILVVDTLAQVTPGANENAGEDMGVVIENCKTLHAVTGATILLVHHSGKDASRGARGWSGIKGALDAELEVTRSENDRCVTISKMKDGHGEGQQFGFRLLDVPLGMDDDGEVFGSCVVEHTDAAVAAVKNGAKGKNEIAIHKIVLDLLDVGDAPTVDEVISEYANRVPHDPQSGRDTRRQHAMRALRGLIDKGVFVADGVRVGLPECAS